MSQSGRYVIRLIKKGNNIEDMKRSPGDALPRVISDCGLAFGWNYSLDAILHNR